MNHEGEKKKGVGKWIVLGCGGCLVLSLVAAAFVVGIGAFVFQIMKGSDAYQEALDRARDSPAVIAAIGEPVEPGIMVWGSIETSGPSGTASISFPISGPAGEATVFVEAEKSAGEWQFHTLQVELEDSGERIDLLGQHARPGLHES